MAKRNEVYKCNVCGNVVVLVNAGGGELVCCNKPMELLKEKTADEGKEKHLPIIEEEGKGIIVKVGGIQHPMEDKHYIQWIEVQTKENVCRKYLRPGDTPEAVFNAKMEDVTLAREYCTLHGLWKSV
ncbi:desulfoferrodoxin [Spirochaetota bacterium]